MVIEDSNEIQSESPLDRALKRAKDHVVTPEEKEQQRQSWVRGEMAMGNDRDEARWRKEHMPSTSPTQSFLNLEPIEKIFAGAVLFAMVTFLTGFLIGVRLQANAERSARIFRECGLPSDEDYAACVKSLDSRSEEVHDGDLGAVSSNIEEGV